MTIRDLLPWRGRRSLTQPTRELHHLQHRIDRLFDEFFNAPFSHESIISEPLLGEGYSPVCDVDETDTHYLINFDLPGVKKDEVKIEVRDSQISISGERKVERKEKGNYERSYGSFYRALTLPSNIDADHIEANYENGVLQIAIPKTKAIPGKQIPIKEGKLVESKTDKEKK